MADEFLKVITDRLKKLPGFSLFLILVSSFYLKAFGRIELAWESTAVLALSWAAYRLSSRLDKPLYDSPFGPDHWKLSIIARLQRDLDNLRDRVVSKIFGPAGIHTYRDAVAKGKVTERVTPRFTAVAKLC
jgi:hypothetical protein